MPDVLVLAQLRIYKLCLKSGPTSHAYMPTGGKKKDQTAWRTVLEICKQLTGGRPTQSANGCIHVLDCHVWTAAATAVLHCECPHALISIESSALSLSGFAIVIHTKPPPPKMMLRITTALISPLLVLFMICCILYTELGARTAREALALLSFPPTCLS